MKLWNTLSKRSKEKFVKTFNLNASEYEPPKQAEPAKAKQ